MTFHQSWDEGQWLGGDARGRHEGESFLNQRTLQLENSQMSQHMQEQHAAVWPCNHLTGKHAQAIKILIETAHFSVYCDLFNCH